MSGKMNRFTQRARKVLSLAQEEAERMKHSTLGSEHLLLGLMREDGGVAGRVLRELGLDLPQVQEMVERLSGPSQSPKPTKIELTSSTERTLELAIDESRRMGQPYISTEHILLGLLRHNEGLAIDVLNKLGVTPEQIRRQTRHILLENPPLPAEVKARLRSRVLWKLDPTINLLQPDARQILENLFEAAVAEEGLTLSRAEYNKLFDEIATEIKALQGPRPSRLQHIQIRSSTSEAARNSNIDLKTRVQNKILVQLDPSMDRTHSAEARKTIEDLFESILNEENIVLARSERKRLFEQIIADLSGLGPLESLLQDETITTIMVNGPKNIFVEREGKFYRAPLTFESDEHLRRVIGRILSPLGRRVDGSHPFEDVRLSDGSRVTVVVPPLALTGPTLTIHKFIRKFLTVEQLIEYESVTPEMIEFVKAAVMSGANIAITGDPNGGKTTLLNVLAQFIPPDERIVTLENTAELQLRQEHVVTLESRPATLEGEGAVSLQALIPVALKLRPDRLLVGEVQGGEAFELLRVIYIGQGGVMFALHATDPRDALNRIELMAMSVSPATPSGIIRQQIAAALDLIVHIERLRDGSRRVTAVSEVNGMEKEVIRLADIFVFNQTGIKKGRVIGRLKAAGLRPRLLERIEKIGINLPPQIFGTE